MRVALAVIAALGAILLFLLASASANTALFAANYTWLLAINGIAALALLVLVGLQLRRLRRDFRDGVFGSRLKSRLLLMLSLMAVLPGALVYGVSMQFAVKSIDSWFDVRVDTALEGGLSLGRGVLDGLQADLLAKTRNAALDLGDYTPRDASLVVRGKGNKERLVYLTGGAAEWLADWLARRGDAPGPLFWPVTKGGDLQPRRMTSQALYDALAKRARAVGVDHLSPHDLRRSFISDMLDAGADIATVQKLAGHASPTTTARYDRRGEDAKRRAVALLHVPHHARRPGG